MGTLPVTRFYLDDGTGNFPYDITAYCLLRDGLTIKRGREDWQAAVTAGEFSVTLNNADGRFTPGSTKIASPSPIKVDTRIRVKETINGITYNRFTGYVKSWPVAWPWTVSTLSEVTITATDAQARAQRRPLKSVIEEEILADSPAAYYQATFYRLAEPAGAGSAADSTGQNRPPLALRGSGSPVVFGGTMTSSTGREMPAAQFFGTGSGANAQWLDTGYFFGADRIECFFATTTANQPILLDGYDVSLQIIGINAAGKLFSGLGGMVSAASVNDGQAHHALIQVGASPGNEIHLWLDGVKVDSHSPWSSLNDRVFAVGLGYTGYIANVVHGPVIADGRVTDHALAGLTGLSGEPGTARITRLAGYANTPLGTLDSSLTNVPAADFTGTDAWPAIEQVGDDAEGGLVFIDGSGGTTFHNRNKVAAKTAPDLTLDRQYVTPDVQAVTDDQQLLNYLDVTSETTQVTQTVRDTTSETNHGRYADSKSYLVQTDAEALDRGNWLLFTSKEPGPRYGTLTIDLFKMTPAMAQSVIAAIEPNCWLRITSMPSQTPGGTTADVIVQGFEEQQSGNSWRLVCNVTDKATVYPSVWILGDSTYGVLDSTTRLYV